MILDYWKSGCVDALEPSILLDEQDDETRRRRGMIHPRFMGGEYLPSYLEGKVEIARICLRSITWDVISLRARPTPEGIAYRVEDEYEGRFTLPIQMSKKTLTLAEVVRQFDEGNLEGLDWGGGLSLGYYNMNAESSDKGDRDHLVEFTRITSPIYTQLERHYGHVFEEWAAVGQDTLDDASSESQGGAL